MRAYAIRWLTFPLGIALQGYRLVDIERITEHHLFCQRIDMKRTIFGRDFVELLIIVATVHPQPLEHIGVIL